MEHREDVVTDNFRPEYTTHGRHRDIETRVIIHETWDKSTE